MNEIALQAISMILLANVVRQMELSLNPWYSYPPVKEPNKSFCKDPCPRNPLVVTFYGRCLVMESTVVIIVETCS